MTVDHTQQSAVFNTKKSEFNTNIHLSSVEKCIKKLLQLKFCDLQCIPQPDPHVCHDLIISTASSVELSSIGTYQNLYHREIQPSTLVDKGLKSPSHFKFLFLYCIILQTGLFKHSIIKDQGTLLFLLLFLPASFYSIGIKQQK